LRSGEFYSRGKFLLSAEYLVLYGAKALAVPLKLGQRMVVTEIPLPGLLKWETYVQQKLWFTSIFQLRNMEIMETSDEVTANFIQKLLIAGGELKPGLPATKVGFQIQNYIDFDISWGLGSSSSLVSNLAYWLDIDPFALHSRVFRGSGYDIFCARATKPILYQVEEGRPDAREIIFNPSFKENLYFVYSGRKQNSRESVRRFLEQHAGDEAIIKEISRLTGAMVKAKNLGEFLALMLQHEEALSSVLGLKMLKEELFPDFPGQIKSLGAWGGDFFMAGTTMSPEEVKDYFSNKNLDVVFRWDEIVL
jgi:mevalonate kinase